jgi:hypothetical protein
MKKIIRKKILTITGAMAGAIAGFFYWKFIGCSTGTCYIQSNAVRMTLYGALLGGLSLNILQPKIKQQQHGK